MYAICYDDGFIINLAASMHAVVLGHDHSL